MEDLIRANLRVRTWETVFQKALGTVVPAGGQSTVIHVFETKGYVSKDMLLTVCTSHFYTYKERSQSWGTLTPYKMKKERYCLRSSDPL